MLIADDHAPTRAGIRGALERAGWDVVADVADGWQAVECALQTRPDVCLLDITMPGSGIRAAGTITQALHDVSIVMLTASRDDRDLFDALRAGAQGYLLKDMDPERLGAALEGVLRGEAALPRQLMSRVVEEFRGRDRRRMLVNRNKGPRLTSREFEVLDLLRLGLSTEDVATRLFISPVTVRGYVADALKKLRVSDRQAAFRLLDEGEPRP